MIDKSVCQFRGAARTDTRFSYFSVFLFLYDVRIIFCLFIDPLSRTHIGSCSKVHISFIHAGARRVDVAPL